MLRWLTGTWALKQTARELYGAVVTQARTPSFYAALGVPDTAEGRFELIALHLSLLLERLAVCGGPGRRLSQHLIEAFVTDMDDNMREMGVGDLTVPRKVKRAAAALFERAARYRQALAEPTDARLAALLGELLATTPESAAVGLAAYVRRSATTLAGVADDRLLAGEVRFAEWKDGRGQS